MAVTFNPFPNDKVKDFSTLKEFTDENFKFDENGKKFSIPVENTVEKGEIARCSSSVSVFKRLALQTHKNHGLFGKGLKIR